MRPWMAFLAIVPACGFQSPSASDANVDAPPTQFGSFVKVKFASSMDLPTTSLTMPADVDTDSSALCNMHNNDQAGTYCVIAGSTLMLPSGVKLRAHGTKPLVLVAITVFDLQGMIDVSSKRGAPQTGAGAASQVACTGTLPATGHSGGYGGSFGGGGGNGGTPISTSGEMAGAPAGPHPLPDVLRGGCPGGDGAMDSATGGIGGSGGGAVAIIASKIRFNGQINASGAGGGGGPVGTNGSGGGGGGSGGMIVLDAAMIEAGTGPNLWLFANGGGGGQGGTGMDPAAGPGQDGRESSEPMTQAPAGNDGNVAGGPGGKGAAGTGSPNGDSAGAAGTSGGGGAGGGGTGFIRSPMIDGLVFAPAPTAP